MALIKKTVDGVLSAFHKTINELQAVADQAEKEEEAQRKKTAAATTAACAAGTEKMRAVTIRGRLLSLLDSEAF